MNQQQPQVGEIWADEHGDKWKVEQVLDAWCDIKCKAVVIERNLASRFLSEKAFLEQFRRVR